MLECKFTIFTTQKEADWISPIDLDAENDDCGLDLFNVYASMWST